VLAQEDQHAYVLRLLSMDQVIFCQRRRAKARRAPRPAENRRDYIFLMVG